MPGDDSQSFEWSWLLHCSFNWCPNERGSTLVLACLPGSFLYALLVTVLHLHTTYFFGSPSRVIVTTTVDDGLGDYCLWRL